jgi:PAS domain-containing protein
MSLVLIAVEQQNLLRVAVSPGLQGFLSTYLYPPDPMAHEHYFICPHCGNRSMGTDRNQGFRREARGCERCGFAYLFELLDDYYPSPNAAFFALDREGRIVDCGKGSYELTGIKTEQAIGQHVGEAIGLSFDDGTDHVGQALEWEVRVHGKPVQVRSHSHNSARAVADLFPAYDDEEGGLLVVLTPRNNHSE